MADVIHLPTSLSSDEVKFAVIVLARRAAREAVKRQLQHAGVRVPLLSCSEISSRANQYLKAHRSEYLAVPFVPVPSLSIANARLNT